MASGSVLKALILTQTEPWQPLPFLTEKRSNFSPFTSSNKKIASPKLPSNHLPINCSNTGNSDSSEQDPPQEALLKAISEVSRREGRVGKATILVIGGDPTTGWLSLDRKVNSYPRTRGFTAIGTGGDDFVQAMVYAVESVVQRPIHQGEVRQKISSRGKYVSVKIGPVRVASSEQVQAVYYAMRRDDRMKYFL